nr:hypothetical protein [Streptomyces sp. I6]
MSRMLSTASTARTRCRRISSSSSDSARAGDLALYCMPRALSPQKVQWCLAPHQQPRENSTSSRWVFRPITRSRPRASRAVK